jgi:hypothetical protein
MVNGAPKQYRLWGDSEYWSNRTWPVLLAPLPHGFLPGVDDDEIDEINTRMASLRVTNEWGFGRWEALFPGICQLQRRTLWDVETGLATVQDLVSLLLCNVHSCLVPNATAQFFDCAPRSSCRRISHRAGLAFLLLVYISNLFIKNIDGGGLKSWCCSVATSPAAAAAAGFVPTLSLEPP